MAKNLKFDILVTRRSLKSGRIKVDAKNYFDAVQIALKKASRGEILWNEESSVIQHDCQDCDPESSPYFS